VVDELVSVIIPVYNRPVLLREAVSSVLAQTYPSFEVIIVDDGSTDETGTVAEALARSEPDRIRVIHQANRGPGAAREAGRRLARGEFIQHLDSDDLLLPRKLELQVRGLRENADCGVSYGKTRYRHRDGRVEPEPWKGSGQAVATMFPSFLRARWWDTPTPLYRASICERAGPWSELRCEEDWEYDCRVAALGVRLHYCEEFVCEVRDHRSAKLAGGERLDPVKLRNRAEAHVRIYQHARRAGVDARCAEMQHFVRELFLIARECGAAGLVDDSQRLLGVARAGARAQGSDGWDLRLYETLARVVGWGPMGRLTCALDAFRDGAAQ
jgi:glycosyltransferase involved in cell wall biosynthesis